MIAPILACIDSRLLFAFKSKGRILFNRENSKSGLFRTTISLSKFVPRPNIGNDMISSTGTWATKTSPPPVCAHGSSTLFDGLNWSIFCGFQDPGESIPVP